MLTLTIPEHEFYNEETKEFIYVKETKLCFEHSLVSLSKWESKWQKPFMKKEEKTNEEIMDYIKFMCITKNVDQKVFDLLTVDDIDKIDKYINSPMTATTFSNNKSQKPNREIVTSELIYYWMIACQIPFECQRWHLNRLLTLIRICDIKNQPPKKMSKNSILNQNRDLNAARRKAMNSKG